VIKQFPGFCLTSGNDHGIMTMSFKFDFSIKAEEFHMENQVAKSKFKPHALQYFREVERTGKALIITDRGKPVLKIVPYSEKPSEALRMLRNSVIKYENPTEPVGLNDWEALK
jgi:prevent-host-death family protein